MRIRQPHIRNSTLIAALLLLTAAFAAEAKESRALFKKAYPGVAAGKSRAADFARLKDYPLYPYLLAAELARELRKAPSTALDKRMRDFLTIYGQQPATQGPRAQWLESLATRSAWGDFLTYLPAKPGEKTRCRAALAKLKLRRSDALADASELWLYGKLRDKACIPVFEWLESSGALSQSLIRGRLALAQEAGEVSVAGSLTRKLQAGRERRQAELWLVGYSSPDSFIAAYINGGHRETGHRTLAKVFKRLTQRNPNGGAARFDALVHKAGFDAQTRGELAAWVGYRKILNRHADALAWYRRAGDAQLDELQRKWRLRSAVRAQDWAAVRDFTQALTPDEASEARWRYWRARALEQLGDGQAQALYAGLAAERSFYGFMAADRINRPYTLEDRPVAANQPVQQQLEARGEVQRAHELFAVGMRRQAREEWNQMLAETDASQQQQAALLALGWGWYSQAALAMGRARYWDDMATRFPVIYRDQVESAAKRERIPAGWIYGIMRSESLFTPDIRSYAGAVGLMQLMPGTGLQVARDIGWRWRGEAGLEDPDYNIRLGSRYLRMMLDRFKQHTALATASYNAGPGNALKWLDDKRLPADVWIETVPFNATHDYLLHVLEYTAVYHWRMTGKPLSLKQLLPEVPARREVD